jgi:hypothetical protein
MLARIACDGCIAAGQRLLKQGQVSLCNRRIVCALLMFLKKADTEVTVCIKIGWMQVYSHSKRCCCLSKMLHLYEGPALSVEQRK